MKNNETLKNRLAELSKQNTLLADHLASMCCQADEDTPSEYRTRHFRNTMDGAYEYLEKINYYFIKHLAQIPFDLLTPVL